MISYTKNGPRMGSGHDQQPLLRAGTRSPTPAFFLSPLDVVVFSDNLRLGLALRRRHDERKSKSKLNRHQWT